MTSKMVRAPATLSRFLRMAVVTGVESAVRIHIDRGDDLNARDDKGQTPLMLSAARNKAAICKLLIDAGADVGLLDSFGKNALDIARSAGAREAASVIEAASFSKAVSDDIKFPDVVAAIALSGDAIDTDSQPSAIHSVLTPLTSSHYQNHCGLAIEIASEPIPIIEWALDADQDSGTFDLTGWEAEEEQPPPEGDSTLSEVASEIQITISDHRPIDTSTDWEDFEAYLPERASPLPRADDYEAIERLRLVLLRVIREGSVPSSSIDDLTRGDDGEPDREAGALLAMVINDLGAETDERFEYSAPYESFEVFVAPEEKPDEEDAIDEALAFVDNLAERRNEPFRLYQRELQGEALLTAEAEVALGQAMELGVEKALDALASWPSGVGAVLDAAKKVVSGAKPLRWLSSGPSVEPQDAEPISSTESGTEFELPTEAVDTEAEGGSQFGLDAKESVGELTEFCANVELLSDLTVVTSQDDPGWSACRDTLASLGLTRGFLVELADSDLAGESEPALAFAQAMKAYRRARDQMTVANLKLVLSIAKKYLFSDQPLDDLLQEGNIGLIKAVERYDWRRGFKFSTYATWWIRQQVGRFVADKGKTIRLPVHVYEKTQRIAQAAHAFELRHGHAPSVEETAVLVALPVHKVVDLSRATLEPLPLHELDEVDGLIAADAKDQFTIRDPMEIVEDRQLIVAVEQFLGTLKPKEECILRMRFGIGIGDSMTLEEVGARLDVTRERVRQIEAHAIRRLRAKLNSLLRDLNAPTTPTPRDKAEDASNESDDESDSQQTAPPLATPAVLPQPRPQLQTSPRPEQPRGSRTSAIDKLLERAQAAGAAIHDDREGESQRIWVHITDTPDTRSRELVRKLIALGFEFWPGKGYWR